MPGVAGEWFLRVGLDDVAYEACGRNIAERIDESRRNVGYEGEVAELDRLEAGEIRAVESQADREEFAVGARCGDGQAVPAPQKIGEFQVDELDAAPLDLGLQFCDRGKDLTTPLESTRSEMASHSRPGVRARISNIFDALTSIKD